MPILIKWDAINNGTLVNFFYLAIICSIGLYLSGWIAVLLSTSLAIAIVINYALITNNSSTFVIITIFQILCLLISCLTIFIIKVLKKQQKISFVLLSSVIEFGIIYLLSLVFFSRNTTYMSIMMIQTTIVWILYIVIYQSLLWYQQFNNKIRSMDTQIIYENKYFLNPNSANKYINLYIQQKNVVFGAIIVFNLINFNRLPRLWGNNIAKYIKNLVLEDLFRSFKEFNPLFFITKNNEYACFIKLENFNGNINAIYKGNNKQIRASDDIMRSIQNKMLNLPKAITYKNKTQQIYAGASAALYGIHSTNIDELIWLCNMTQQKSSTTKQGVLLEVYNPTFINLIQSFSNPTIEDSYFKPYDFQISLLKNNKLSFPLDTFEIQAKCLNKILLNIDEIKSFASNNQVLSNTLRMLAMQGLKLFARTKNLKKSCLIVDYPIQFTTSDKFNLGDFKAKLQGLNIQPHNLIMRFDLSELPHTWVDSTNLINIKNLGIKIIFDNLSSCNVFILKDFQPDYVTFQNYLPNTKINNLLTKLKIKLLENCNIN